jgi:thioester reductase-like protein
MILLTGFPGFLGSFLISRLLDVTSKDTQIVCVVQDKFLALAKEKISQHPDWKDRVLVIVGDITQTNLGLTKEWNERVRQIYHLAAVYDLSVRKGIAHKINVLGTQNVIGFAEACANFKRLDYISTCYVSGRFTGHFFEADLEKKQTFNNHYEETKFEAEVAVQRAMTNGLPATIYRPGIVVGDSHSGWTQKFDGPYYIMQWLDRQAAIAILPELGDYSRIRVNLVPVDFVAESIAKLSVHNLSLGKVYHLADPHPPTIKEFLKMLEIVLEKKIITLPFSPKLTKLSLRHIKPLRNWMKINPDTIDYFTHPTVYDTSNATADLATIGIQCPELSTYVKNLVTYMKQTEDRPTEAMI